MSELVNEYVNPDNFDSYDRRSSSLVEVSELQEVKELEKYPEGDD